MQGEFLWAAGVPAGRSGVQEVLLMDAELPAPVPARFPPGCAAGCRTSTLRMRMDRSVSRETRFCHVEKVPLFWFQLRRVLSQYTLWMVSSDLFD